MRLGPAHAKAATSISGGKSDAAARTDQAIHPGYASCRRFRCGVQTRPNFWVRRRDRSTATKMPNARRFRCSGGAFGVARAGLDDALVAAAEVGYPVPIKPSVGGGGKGMLVEDPARLPEAPAAREAMSSFFWGRYSERFVLRPIERAGACRRSHGNVASKVSVSAASSGATRRLSRPSPPFLSVTRELSVVQNTARCVDYVGAVMVESSSPRSAPDEFFFEIVNTSAVGGTTGAHRRRLLDLTFEWQLRVGVRKAGLRPKTTRAAGTRSRVCGGSRVGIPAHRRPGAGGVFEPAGPGAVDSSLRRHGGRQDTTRCSPR